MSGERGDFQEGKRDLAATEFDAKAFSLLKIRLKKVFFSRTVFEVELFALCQEKPWRKTKIWKLVQEKEVSALIKTCAKLPFYDTRVG